MAANAAAAAAAVAVNANRIYRAVYFSVGFWCDNHLNSSFNLIKSGFRLNILCTMPRCGYGHCLCILFIVLIKPYHVWTGDRIGLIYIIQLKWTGHKSTTHTHTHLIKMNSQMPIVRYMSVCLCVCFRILRLFEFDPNQSVHLLFAG